MRIEIKIESSGGKKVIGFSNDNLNNFNFVDMYIDGVDDEFTLAVDDLQAIVAAFKIEQKNNQ